MQPFGVAQFCPRGHKWSFGGNEKGYQHLMCSSKLPVQMSGDDEEEEKYPTKRCGHKMSWRVQGTLPHYLPDCVSPAQYSDCAGGQMQKEVGLVWRRENCVKQTLVKQEWWERKNMWNRSGGKRTV